MIDLLRRWWLLLVTVVSINVPWHLIRVWLPDTLRIEYGYSKEFVDYFTSLYYVSTFVGSLAAGWIVGWLADRGWSEQKIRAMQAALREFHEKNPLAPGMSKEDLRAREFARAPPFLFEALLAAAKT